MQKRLLALVATVAMVLSMFAGVAFAAPTPEIALSTTKLISSYPHLDYQLISGAVTNLEAGKDYYVKVAGNEGTKVIYDNVEVKKGTFSFYLQTNLLPQNVTVSVHDAKTGDELAKKNIEVRYNVVTTPSKLEFPFTGEKKPEVITGKVTNSKGEPVEGVLVKLGSDYFGSGVPTNSKGEFGYVVLEWKSAGNVALTLEKGSGVDAFGPIQHATATITHKAAAIKVTPNTVVHSLVDTQFEVTGSILDYGTYTPGVPGSIDIKFYRVKGSTEVPLDVDFELDGTDITKVTFKWKPSSTDAGTWTLKAVVGNYSASTTITVVNPANYNLINSSELTKLIVGTNTFKFGYPNNIYLVNSQGEHAPTAGTGETARYVYTVYVDGKLAKTSSDENFEHQPAGTLTITPKKLGTYAIRVVVHIETSKGESTKTYAKVFDQTYTAKVEGWDVEVDVDTLVVNKEQTVTFVVKDANGVPVNNAVVKFDGVDKVDSAKVNIQNGVYVVKDFKPTTVDPIVVTILTKEDVKKAELTLDVVGQNVYSVSADVASLLQGKSEKVKFTVTRDGAAVMPQRIKLVYDKLEPVSLTPTYLGDGVSEVTITAAEAGELTIRVENFDGTLCGETTINVVAPKLVLIDEEAANLTNNFKTKVHFKVIDPRDDSVIKSDLLLVTNEFTGVEVYDADGGVIGTTILGGEEHVLTIMPKVVEAEWDKAAKDGKTVKVSFKIGTTTVDGAFEVKNATITSDPEMIIIGAKNNLTLTYLDANGKPIVGKTVKANNADLGKTDDNGQVLYPAGVVAEPVTVVAATEVSGQTVEKTIKIGYDFEAPQVTYEVDGNKATLVITDNVRLVRINIDGKDIDFWPGARYEHVVTLNPGVNKVRVKAQDSNDNVLDEVVEIEYKTDSVKLEGETVKRQGNFLFVQLRQFEELGAQIAWNQATRTATFVVGDTKVEITVGSTTARVNGQAVTMPVAAFIDAALGRTYVPVRFVSEALGWNVHWAQGDIVTITLP